MYLLYYFSKQCQLTFASYIPQQTIIHSLNQSYTATFLLFFKILAYYLGCNKWKSHFWLGSSEFLTPGLSQIAKDVNSH